MLCYAMHHERYAMLLWSRIVFGMAFIPNRTFLLQFRSVSGEFGRAMVFFCETKYPWRNHTRAICRRSVTEKIRLRIIPPKFGQAGA